MIKKKTGKEVSRCAIRRTSPLAGNSATRAEFPSPSCLLPENAPLFCFSKFCVQNGTATRSGLLRSRENFTSSNAGMISEDSYSVLRPDGLPRSAPTSRIGGPSSAGSEPTPAASSRALRQASAAAAARRPALHRGGAASRRPLRPALRGPRSTGRSRAATRAAAAAGEAERTRPLFPVAVRSGLRRGPAWSANCPTAMRCAPPPVEGAQTVECRRACCGRACRWPAAGESAVPGLVSRGLVSAAAREELWPSEESLVAKPRAGRAQ